MVKKPLTSNWWWIFPRTVILMGLFLILHYVAEWYPANIFFQVIGAVGESMFQHFKIAAFAFILLSLIEIPLSIGELKNDWWWFGKIFSTVFITFVTFILYYFVLMFFAFQPSRLVEIIMANIILFSAYTATSVLEWQFREKKVHVGVKVVLLVLFALVITQFVVYTFKLPIYDVFAFIV